MSMMMRMEESLYETTMNERDSLGTLDQASRLISFTMYRYLSVLTTELNDYVTLQRQVKILFHCSNAVKDEVLLYLIETLYNVIVD